jgi:hypothetical protein
LFELVLRILGRARDQMPLVLGHLRRQQAQRQDAGCDHRDQAQRTQRLEQGEPVL